MRHSNIHLRVLLKIASAKNNPGIDRLERECRRHEIGTNIGRPNRSPSTNLNTRRLRTPISPPLDRLTRMKFSRIAVTHIQKMSVPN